MKIKHFFVLGRFKELSVKELEVKLGLKKYNIIDNLLITEFNKDFRILDELGGIKKFGEIFSDKFNDLEELILKLNRKLNIGFNFYFLDKKDILRIKDIFFKMKLKKRNLRLIFPQKNFELSTGSILKNKLITKGFDFNFIKINKKILIWKTCWVQDIKKFSFFDYNRPRKDLISGMIPPKLARMMINISNMPKNKIFLDPFCGSGTIILEAFILGYKKIIASDISGKAVKDTKINLEWIKKYLNKNSEIKFLVSDIKDLNLKVDLIVTEPYLGPIIKKHTKINKIDKIYYEILSNYNSYFKCFSKLLKTNGKLVLIIPGYKKNDKFIKISSKIDFRKYGSLIEYRFDYLRKNQNILREIFWMIKKT